LLNPAQVAAVRKQQGNRRRKTDCWPAGKAHRCMLTARRPARCVRCGVAAKIWWMRAGGCGSRPGRWWTAYGRGSRPPTSRPGSPRCSPARSTPRLAGWWSGCSPRAGPQAASLPPVPPSCARSSPPVAAGCLGRWLVG
jgi:hypothetical protein